MPFAGQKGHLPDVGAPFHREAETVIQVRIVEEHGTFRARIRMA